MFEYLNYLQIYLKYLNLVKLYTLTHVHTVKTYMLKLCIKWYQKDI